MQDHAQPCADAQPYLTTAQEAYGLPEDERIVLHVRRMLHREEWLEPLTASDAQSCLDAIMLMPREMRPFMTFGERREERQRQRGLPLGTPSSPS